MNKIKREELEELPLDELLERYSLEELAKLIPLKKLLEKFPDAKEDPKGEPGVLLSDEIERYITEFKLICPFDRENLKAASYRLTVGDEYALGGKKGRLYDKEKDEITILPFEVAIIKSREIINMPRFLVGRWNILVTRAYQGLLWVGGPQVDPGWVGHLYCPIYNLSNEEVKLKLGDPLARIDFTRTTNFKKESENSQFPRPPKRTSFDEYNWKLKSALFTEAGERIDGIETKVNRVESLIGIMFTCIAVLFAALSIFVTSQSQGASESASLPPWIIVWVSISVGLSIVAIAISLFSRVRLEIKNRRFKTIVSIFYVAYVVLSAIALIALGTILW